ncbi:MAG: tRNA pseudouridine(13) synthase TruD [Archangium sp.]|nr:tRNA pseudouridine(13) synthase TruD [Archangium sp.]
MTEPLPRLTASIPGCGGLFKASPDDFEVEELPAYEPQGEPGSDEHLFLWVEKKGRSTQDVAKALARHCGINERDVSWAGLKDRDAVTRQYLCGPARFLEPKLASFSMEGVRVLRSARHKNKLKSGHLHGNRFRVVLREVKDLGAARASIELLKRSGIPNYFGEQRFGLGGLNAARGKAILEKGGKHRDRFERKLFLSAFQSDLFNRVLAKRLVDGSFARAVAGDVLKRHPLGGEFVCEDPAVEQPRIDGFEVSPSGPLFGPEMKQPTGAIAALEDAVLAEQKIDRALFVNGGDETRGARRWLRIPFGFEGLESPTSDVLELRFTLPAGSYATVVLRELLAG